MIFHGSRKKNKFCMTLLLFPHDSLVVDFWCWIFLVVDWSRQRIFFIGSGLESGKFLSLLLFRMVKSIFKCKICVNIGEKQRGTQIFVMNTWYN